MSLPEVSDLRAIDRDVARAWASLAAWKRAVAKDPEGHAADAPLEQWRHVAGQTMYEALGALAPSQLDAPLREALRRWVRTLTQARVTLPVDAELAKARAERTERVALLEGREAGWTDAWRGVVAAPTARERSAWIEVAAARGRAIAGIVKRREERRDEVARRLGLEGAPALANATPAALESAAEALLARTDDLARDLLQRARRAQELADDPPLAVDAIAVAVARDAPEGWPARLAAPWLETTFGAFAKGLRIDLPPLAPPVGASSFARACAAFGAALRVAGASPSLPFALARDPQPVAAHRFACLFGALPATEPFQRRVLGNGARTAETQARVLGRTALFHARLQATRVLLAAGAPRDRFEHLTHRLFGAPLPPSLAGAWPAIEDDGPARFVGLVTARVLAAEMVDRFDVDWFANPRAVQHLRALASGPAREEAPEDLGAPAVSLGRAFEEALG